MVGKKVVGANGFEPSTSWSRISSRNTILLARLALFCVEHADMGPYSAAIGLKSDPTIWGEPLGWHKLFGHSFRFHRRILASPSRRRGLGKGTAFESLSPEVL